MAPSLGKRRCLDTPGQHPLSDLSQPLASILKGSVLPSLWIDTTTPENLANGTGSGPDRGVEVGTVCLFGPHVGFTAYYKGLLLGSEVGERIVGVHCSRG